MDAASEPSELTSPARCELPPLRIHHLLAWMTVTAVLISVSLWFDRTARNGPPIKSQIVAGSLILGSIAIAGAWTCVGWGVFWRRQGFAFPKYPGDWLLIIVAFSTVALVAELIGVFLAFFIEEDLLAIYYPLAALALLAFWLLLNFRGIKYYADTVAWRVVFVAMMVLGMTTAFNVSANLIVGVLICLAWAAWSDLRNQIARGWTHWFGVVVALSLGIAAIGAFGF